MNNSNKTYSLTQENKGGMWKNVKEYTFIEVGPKPIFIIKYSRKNFRKEVIQIVKIDLDNSSYDLIIYGLSLMRLTQLSEAATATPTFYG